METVKSKIFCIGSNLESYECLKYLIDRGCSIDTLITLPSGTNENVSDYYDLHLYCSTNGINVIDTKDVNSQKTINDLKVEKPDYLFTLGWSQIFKTEFINCFSKFIIGTHPTKLPYGRGRAPLPWTILEEIQNSAVSFFKIDTGVDTGKLIFQRNFQVPKRVYVKELYSIVAQELSQGFYEIYQLINDNKKIIFSDQNENGATVRGKRTPADGLIQFDQTISEMEKLIRAVSEPFPGAYCYYKDQKIIFWRVEHDTETNYHGTLGQILKKNSNGILVQFLDGNLWLNHPTFDNKESVDLKFFRVGERLGYNIQDEIFYLKNRLR
ncbi:formyltransferase family protein [Arenibacter palladensis]|uniref:formyltransferase family protein n=1 Tax=Arenibacter palladensis TaxID=237373 RepID=UPI002FD76C8B